MAASRPVEWRHFVVILLKSTASILAAAMFVGDRMMASTSLHGRRVRCDSHRQKRLNSMVGSSRVGRCKLAISVKHYRVPAVSRLSKTKHWSKIADFILLDLSVLATRLAGKSVSDMTYLVSSGTMNLYSIDQSYPTCIWCPLKWPCWIFARPLDWVNCMELLGYRAASCLRDSVFW